ncbi:glycosyltransferase [Agilicoccus flavus]|uniref:glycosyltransferase n=1 Tax=Agilicoccus flavus TaxID=2775968 RepID=UPI001CF61477|nr:glycosyltransferase [Agilicoccus flavus]
MSSEPGAPPGGVEAVTDPATDPPHVLYVAWGYPPSRGGGVYRALATANGFAEAGCRVTVLTAERETFIEFTGADFSLEDKIHPDIEIVRLPFSWPAMETNIRKWPALRAFAPKLWRKRQLRNDTKNFPENGYGPWREPLEAAALDIHRRRPVDLVVASANPNVDFMAADVLHRRHGVPYVMDYRDAWMLDVFDGSFLHEQGGRVDQLEKRLLNSAREVWFVNEPIRAWHQRRHPHLADRMHVVANGYDPEFAPLPSVEPAAADAPLTFGYIGTASAKVPLAEFAEGWRLARGRHEALAGARAQLWGYLGFYSAPSHVLLTLVDAFRPDGLSYEGPVPKAKVQSTYASFDACLLILGAGKYVTSGKVFEYAASALPIVAVHDPGNAATDVLREYPLWFPVADLEPESIATALEAAAVAAREADPATREACREFARRYSRELQLAPRIEALRDGITGTRTSPKESA